MTPLMSDVIQYVLVGVIVLAAVLVTLRSVMRSIKGRKTALTACACCKLRDSCQCPDKNSTKKCADKVAQVKKLQ